MSNINYLLLITKYCSLITDWRSAIRASTAQLFFLIMCAVTETIRVFRPAAGAKKLLVFGICRILQDVGLMSGTFLGAYITFHFLVFFWFCFLILLKTFFCLAKRYLKISFSTIKPTSILSSSITGNILLPYTIMRAKALLAS